MKEFITILEDLLNEEDPLRLVLLLLHIMEPPVVVHRADQSLGGPIPSKQKNYKLRLPHFGKI